MLPGVEDILGLRDSNGTSLFRTRSTTDSNIMTHTFKQVQVYHTSNRKTDGGTLYTHSYIQQINIRMSFCIILSVKSAIII